VRSQPSRPSSAVAREDLARELESRWLVAWASLHVAPPVDLLTALAAAYRQAHRRYHTLDHVRDCLQQAEAFGDAISRRAELELAIWFHDAVYEPLAQQNEAKSARWAGQALRAAGLEQATAGHVEALVLSTRHDQQADGPPLAGDEAALVDIDLAVLGAPEREFDRFERAIRAEYQAVPEQAYREGRLHVLGRFLERPTIYATERYRARYERPARQNLQRTVALLAAR